MARTLGMGLLGALLLSMCFCPVLAAGPEVGLAPPALKLAKAMQAPEGAKVTWEALKGKVVVLEFWATWCGPCVAAIPHLNELAGEFKGRPVQFIAVTDEDEATVRPFLAKRPIQAWIGLDADGATSKAYGVTAIPRTVLVDKEGRLAGVTHPNNLTSAVLKDLLAGKKVSLPQESDKTVPAGKLPDDKAGQKNDDALVRVVLRRSTESRGGMSAGPGKVTYEGISLRTLVQYAYGGSSYDTDWRMDVSQDRYDVSILVPKDRQDRIDSILQGLLRDTFGITGRREAQSRDVLLLKVPAGGTVKLTEAASKAVSVTSGSGTMRAVGLSMGTFARNLAGNFDRPVIDETGIQGRYDFDLKWNGQDLDSLAKAVREKYGLELVPAERQVSILIVESEGTTQAKR